MHRYLHTQTILVPNPRLFQCPRKSSTRLGSRCPCRPGSRRPCPFVSDGYTSVVQFYILNFVCFYRTHVRAPASWRVGPLYSLFFFAHQAGSHFLCSATPEFVTPCVAASGCCLVSFRAGCVGLFSVVCFSGRAASVFSDFPFQRVGRKKRREKLPQTLRAQNG